MSTLRTHSLWIALLMGALVAGSLWQWQARAHQQLDLGGPLDDGAALFFHAPERGAGDSSLTFRWSRRESELRLLAPSAGAASVLSLRAFPPAAQPVDIGLRAGETTATVTIAPPFRIYRLLVRTPRATDELRVVLAASPTRLPADPRQIGIGLDWARLDTLSPLTLSILSRELFTAPFLPIGLVLLALSAGLLEMPRMMRGGAPLAGLAAIALTGALIPEGRLRLIPYLVDMAAAAVLVLALFRAVRRARSVPKTDRRAVRWIAVTFVLLLLVTFIPSIKGDGVRYYAYLRSLALDGDLRFDNEFATLEPGVDVAITPTGYRENNAAVGPAFAWAPLFGIAHLLALFGQALNVPWAADGYSPPYVTLVAFGSALAGLATMLGCYRIMRRWVDPAPATLATLALVAGSNLLYYTMREGSFAHAFSALTATLFVLAWLRLEEQPSLGRWAAVGASAGAVVTTYWIGALILLLPALTIARLLWVAVRGPARDRGRALTALLAGGALAGGLALLVFLPQMLAWWVIYGSPLVIPHGGDYVRPRDPQALRLLFSHLYGLLPWTPAFFVGLVGLPLLWRRSAWLTVCLIAAGGLYFFYNASLGRWYAGGSFGLRRLTLLTPWFAIGLALVFDRLRRVRAGLPVALAAITTAWAILLLVRYDFYLIPHLPEDIEDMPRLAFYLSREALPLWALPPWLSGGFLLRPLYGFGAPGEALGFALIAVTMTLILAVVLLVTARFLSARTGPDLHEGHEGRESRMHQQQTQHQ